MHTDTTQDSLAHGYPRHTYTHGGYCLSDIKDTHMHTYTHTLSVGCLPAMIGRVGSDMRRRR